VHQVQAGGQNQQKHAGQKQRDVALDPGIDLLRPCGGLLIDLIVLNQQPGDGGTQGGLARLKRQTDLSTRLFFVAVSRQIEDAIQSVPELGHGTG